MCRVACRPLSGEACCLLWLAVLSVFCTFYFHFSRCIRFSLPLQHEAFFVWGSTQVAPFKLDLCSRKVKFRQHFERCFCVDGRTIIHAPNVILNVWPETKGKEGYTVLKNPLKNAGYLHWLVVSRSRPYCSLLKHIFLYLCLSAYNPHRLGPVGSVTITT